MNSTKKTPQPKKKLTNKGRPSSTNPSAKRDAIYELMPDAKNIHFSDVFIRIFLRYPGTNGLLFMLLLLIAFTWLLDNAAFGVAVQQVSPYYLPLYSLPCAMRQ